MLDHNVLVIEYAMMQCQEDLNAICFWLWAEVRSYLLLFVPQFANPQVWNLESSWVWPLVSMRSFIET